MREKKRTIIVEVISALFILLFVYAALSKMQEFEQFQVELSKSPVLNAYSKYIAIFIPGIELLIAISLITNRFQFLALYASFTLMVMFSAYVVVILKFSSYIPCSCGGILENMTWIQHLIFNMGFVILSIIAILLYPYKSKSYLQ
nr:MauE/DoxX family redox-associated membrane protein [Pedobacter panaciterrae]